MTVLFVDLVGSTALVDRMDPEDLIDLMGSYQVAVTSTAERHNGVVSGYLGDGLRVLFGFPAAHEEAPQQAIRASLAILQVVQRLRRESELSDGISLQARIGIATGTVVASLNAAISRLDDNLIGSPLNLAARLQGLAAPNEIIVSDVTQRLTETSFSFRDLGAKELRGFQSPLRVFAVQGEVRGQSRLARRLRQTRTPMVNRVSELQNLTALWERARTGSPQFVTIIGDAGMGKSRLAYALAERLTAERHGVVWLQCTSTLRNTALHPHVELIERVCGFEADDDGATRLGKLRAMLAEEEEGEASEALLAAILSLPASPGLALPEMSAQRQKQLTFDVLLRLILREASRAPTLLVYEDLHWMDPTSRELAAQLSACAGTASLMVVATARPESDPPWETAHAATMRLHRLSATESAQIVTAFAGSASLPPTAVDRIVAQTDGVPLFVEEMVRMVLDSGGVTSRLDLPETLRDLLTERLDQLGPARAIAQIGAVIGRTFSIVLAARVLGANPASLSQSIERLLGSGLVENSDQVDLLVFKHALVQDAAYGSMLSRHRRQLHGRVAESLIAHTAGAGDAAPEEIARHLGASGAVAEAARWWLRAGSQAIDRGAAAEAVAHLEAGLAGLAGLPAGEDRLRAELDLLAALGPAQMVRNGPGSPLFGAVQRRAYETSHALPDRPALFPITYGLALFHWGRAEFDSAGELANSLIVHARVQSTTEYIMAGNNIHAMVQFHRGAARASAALLHQSTSLYDPDRDAPLYGRYMMDFGVFGRFYLALSQFILGEDAAAMATATAAWELASSLDQPHSKGFAMLAQFVVAALRRDAGTARRWAEDCIAFSTEQGFPEFIGMGLVVRGWALGQQGEVLAGLRILDEGISLWHRTGFETWQSWFGVLRAELLIRADRNAEAMDELLRQEHRIASNGERQFESLLRVWKARALARLGATHDAIESAYRTSVVLAERQEAPAWCSYAAMALENWQRGSDDNEQTSSAVWAFPDGTTHPTLVANAPSSPTA